MLKLEEISQNTQTINKIVETIKNPLLKEKVKNILKKYPEYFTAPASSNEDYYRAYPGGLVEHALSVLQWLIRLDYNLTDVETYNNDKNTHRDTLIFLALFFALGKIEIYEWNTNEWERNNRGRNYIFKDETFLSVPHRSIRLLANEGVVLEKDIYLAILLAENQDVEDIKKYIYREPDLALLLSWANRWAIQEFKKAKREKK